MWYPSGETLIIFCFFLLFCESFLLCFRSRDFTLCEKMFSICNMDDVRAKRPKEIKLGASEKINTLQSQPGSRWNTWKSKKNVFACLKSWTVEAKRLKEIGQGASEMAQNGSKSAWKAKRPKETELGHQKRLKLLPNQPGKLKNSKKLDRRHQRWPKMVHNQSEKQKGPKNWTGASEKAKNALKSVWKSMGCL